MNDKINEKTVILPPFKHLIMTIGELPSSYLETMTYYEMLVWFTKYLGDTVIPALNENGEAVTELQGLFTQLQTYVNNYFDNLDVQEEVNTKLDEMAESGQLTDIIAQYLGLAGMIAFDTVADMKLAENLVNGSKCRTLGFHSVNDGGGAYYKIRTVTNEDVIDEASIIAVYDNLLVAELILDDEINVKQFGAYGDNTHDDTSKLQNCLNFAFDNEKHVFIPSGNYLHSGLIFPCASFGVANFNIHINGNSRGDTILTHTGTSAAITVTPRGSNDQCNGIKITNLNISCNENTTVGIELPKGTRIHLENINVNGSNICVRNSNNFWLSSFKNMYLSPSGEESIGMVINGSSITSIDYDEIYVYGSSKYGYHLQGGYSHIGILAADNCSGDEVYHFNYFNGSIDALACENPNVETVINLRYSSPAINNVSIYNPNNETLVSIYNCYEGKPTILTTSLTAPNAASIEKPLATLSTCNLILNSITGNLKYNQKTATNNNTGVLSYNNLKIRGNSRPYIGNDRSVSPNTTPYNSNLMGVAIFTDCTTNPALGSDGTNYKWTTPVKQGDWFIENKPSERNVAAYVLLEDGGVSHEVGDAKRASIPLILKGTTLERPSNMPAGGMYLDTTLGKPIWYTGSAWVDATGTTV